MGRTLSAAGNADDAVLRAKQVLFSEQLSWPQLKEADTPIREMSATPLGWLFS